MPLELHIVHASEFIQMNPEGRFDLAASKVALAEIALACRKRGLKHAMIDLRALHPGPKPVFTPGDLAELVSTFRDVGFTHDHRLAILYGSDPHRRARLFAFLSTMHGWAVQAFGDFEQAFLWLSREPEPAPPRNRPPGEKPVPVRFSTARRKAPVRKAPRTETRRMARKT
jgi:hypothetical protein